MKASELRLGNYILNTKYGSNGYVMTVDSIGTFGVNVELGWEGYNPCLDYDCSFDKAEQIPLTEEWLLNFGYIQVCGYYHKGCLEISKIKDKKGFDVYITDGDFAVFATEIEHVHELQNLHFAIHKEELIYNEQSTN